MVCSLKLPVGIDSFEKIRKNKFYYIDKTKLIEQLVEDGGEVTLLTRPRRFGKTLNMSMLRAFFEIGADTSLFEGLYISENKTLCEEHMGKYPVIFLSLKSVEGLTFESAKYRIIELIGREAKRFDFLLESDRLSEDEKWQYKAITEMKNGKFSMDEDILASSIQILSYLLFRHFGKKAVILIDEYDVPLDKAFGNGYYHEMVLLIRGIFGMALKSNESLAFAVLTGCLRITKESIFTGLNNFKVLSILDSRFDEQFGFTDNEVKKILKDYDLASHFEETKEWYDGYHSNWLIKSNAESGTGYSDILVEVPTNRTGIVIELKYADDGNLDKASEVALKQIEQKEYVTRLKQDGMKNFIKYGIACFKKVCKVMVAEEFDN